MLPLKKCSYLQFVTYFSDQRNPVTTIVREILLERKEQKIKAFGEIKVLLLCCLFRFDKVFSNTDKKELLSSVIVDRCAHPLQVSILQGSECKKQRCMQYQCETQVSMSYNAVFRIRVLVLKQKPSSSKPKHLWKELSHND